MKQASRFERLRDGWADLVRFQPELRVSALVGRATVGKVAASFAAIVCVSVGVSLLTRDPDGEPFSGDSGYVVQTAVRGDLDVRVTASGTIEPVRIVEVSTELSGTIKDIAVDFNDTVKAGQLLAKLDDAVPAKQLVRAQAALRLAEARLREGQIDLQLANGERMRKQGLATRLAVSERELETAIGAFNKAASRVEILEAELAIARAETDLAASNLAKTRIVSPIDGVVLRRNVERGQVIAASFQSPVLFRIAADLKRMQVKVDVDEADAMAVKPGQAAVFKGQAMRDLSVQAEVQKIYLGPEVVQGVITYKAIIGFDNADLQLKPGMTATTDVLVAQRRGVLLVPNAALRFQLPARAIASPPAPEMIAQAMAAAVSPHPVAATTVATSAVHRPDARRLYKLKRGKLAPVLVRTGETDGTYTEILEGDVATSDRLVVDIAPATQ